MVVFVKIKIKSCNVRAQEYGAMPLHSNQTSINVFYQSFLPISGIILKFKPKILMDMAPSAPQSLLLLNQV